MVESPIACCMHMHTAASESEMGGEGGPACANEGVLAGQAMPAVLWSTHNLHERNT